MLRRVIGAVPAFPVSLARLGWFGDRVVWLAPDPAGPIRDLTAAIGSRFGGLQPYGGEFDEVIPHLTIGHDHPVEQPRAAGEQVLAAGPIRARLDRVRLITGRRVPGEAWTTVAEYPLGAALE